MKPNKMTLEAATDALGGLALNQAPDAPQDRPRLDRAVAQLGVGKSCLTRRPLLRDDRVRSLCPSLQHSLAPMAISLLALEKFPAATRLRSLLRRCNRMLDAHRKRLIFAVSIAWLGRWPVEPSSRLPKYFPANFWLQGISSRNAARSNRSRSLAAFSSARRSKSSDHQT